MTQKKVARVRRTIAAPASSPTSRGGLETGSGDSIFDAARQEEIRLRIPRKTLYGTAVNPILRDLDLKLKMFRYTNRELNAISAEVERRRTAWEVEQERRARYANKSYWIKP